MDNWHYIPIFFLILLYSTSTVAQQTFYDTFSAIAYNNSDGTQPWASNWTETNDDNAASTGYIRITGNELRMRYLWTENIRRTANLSSYSSAILSFDWRTVSLESGETLAVQISSDGTSFTTLATFTGTQSDTFSQDISSYISANTTVLFLKGGGNWSGNDDDAFIDNFLISTGQDTDGDGISDNVDLDDDNDGMTDEEEYCTTANTTFLVSSDVGERSVIVNHTDTGYLRLDFSSMDNSFQLQVNGNPVHPSIFEFENGALGSGEEYFVFQSDNTFISSPWVANVNGLPRLRLIVNEFGQANLYGTRTPSSTALEPMQAQAVTPFNTTNWISDNNNVFTVTNQAGPGPEGFTGSLFASAVCDTDGDGISNELDLDADNDGIYDIVESGVLSISGVSDVNNDGRIDGAIAGSGSNGLFNSIENNDTPYANQSYTPSDSDADGTADPFSLDADGDSCNDVIEAGFTDNTSDGYLGPLPVIVNGSGIVTSGSDGYTTPDDINTNTAYDFQETGILPTISSQPSSTPTCPGCSTTLSVTSTGDIYQWQLFNGSTWDDLAESSLHSGTTTNSLQIINPTPNENNNQYRILIMDSSFVCGVTTSNTATLSIRVNSVISNRRITYRVKKN